VARRPGCRRGGKHVPPDFRVSITNAPGKDAYAISSIRGCSCTRTPRTKDRRKAMVDFVKWALTDGQKFAGDLGHAPLPAGIR